MKAYRIDKEKWAATAKTGEGARRVGGRWNSAGLPVVYTSEHLSLAILEVLVHAPSPSQRTVARVLTEITMPDSLVDTLLPKSLPADYGPLTPLSLTQEIGDRWLKQASSVGFLVPSAIVPTEMNLLLNPAHADYAKVVWGDFKEISLDPRLWAVG